MYKISAVSDIPTLLIPPALINQASTMLRELFTSGSKADKAWADLECQLLHISHYDDLPMEEADIYKLLAIVDRIEWIISLDDENMLSRSITSRAGQCLAYYLPTI